MAFTTKTSLTDSEARRQEKLRRRRERDRQRRAKKIAEQREERFARLREISREIANAIIEVANIIVDPKRQ